MRSDGHWGGQRKTGETATGEDKTEDKRRFGAGETVWFCGRQPMHYALCTKKTVLCCNRPNPSGQTTPGGGPSPQGHRLVGHRLRASAVWAVLCGTWPQLFTPRLRYRVPA